MHKDDTILVQVVESVIDRPGIAKEPFDEASQKVLDMSRGNNIIALEEYTIDCILNSCIMVGLVAAERKDDNFEVFIRANQESCHSADERDKGLKVGK